MRIKNLEKAFDERIKEIDNQLYMNQIDVVTSDVERHCAEVAFNQLKKDETYRIFDRQFGKNDISGYEHDKDLYHSIVLMARYSSQAVQEIAERHGMFVGDIIATSQTHDSPLKKSFKRFLKR